MNRWKLNLWILWVTQIISLASFGFGLPFISLYMQELEVMTPEKVKIMTGILAAAPALTMGIMAPIWGYIADHYGRKLMIMRAMVFAIFIIGGMGLVSNVNQLLFLRLMQGLVTGTVTAAVAFVASNTPEDKLTYALGVITSSTFIGYSLGPMIGGAFAEIYGYSNSFLLGGALMAVGAFLVIVFVKEDKSTLIQKTSAPKIGFFEKYKKVLMPVVITVLFMLFFLRISRSLFAPYVAIFVGSKFPSSDGVALTTGIVNGLVGFSTAISSMIIGSIASRLDKIKVLKALLIFGTVIMIVITQYSQIAERIGVENDLWVFVIIYMLFFFVVGGVEPILTSTSALSVKSEDRGGLFGLQGMIGSIAWFVAPMIAGPISVKYSLEAIVWVVPIILFINLLLSIKLGRLAQKS